MGAVEENARELEDNDFALGQKFSQHRSQRIRGVIKTEGEPGRGGEPTARTPPVVVPVSGAACLSRGRDSPGVG